MKKSLAQAIHWTNLEEGTVYRLRVPGLGEVLARLVNKETLQFEITEGRLQSHADRKKQWHVGDVFDVLPGMFDVWEVR